MPNIVPIRGSLADYASGGDLVSAILNVKAIILLDASWSMDTIDWEDELEFKNMRRIDRAKAELNKIQALYPGQIALVSFASIPVFHADGIVSEPYGNTNMKDALRFIQVADGINDITFILISDGEPDNEAATLAVAYEFVNKINTVFIGPKGGGGEYFLQRIADATGGTYGVNYCGNLLSGTIIKMLGA